MKYEKIVTHKTEGFLSLSQTLQSRALLEFEKELEQRNSKTYSVLDGLVVFSRNGGGYTAALAEEYWGGFTD